MATAESTGNPAFIKAAKEVNELQVKPSDTELLELYGLYKQSIVGDNETTKPGFMELKNKTKWQAWEDRKGTSKEDAQSAYITLAEKIVAKYSS